MSGSSYLIATSRHWVAVRERVWSWAQVDIKQLLHNELKGGGGESCYMVLNVCVCVCACVIFSALYCCLVCHGLCSWTETYLVEAAVQLRKTPPLPLLTRCPHLQLTQSGAQLRICSHTYMKLLHQQSSLYLVQIRSLKPCQITRTR